MKRSALWKISLITTVEAEDAVAELLGRVFANTVSSYTDAETWQTEVAVFCEKGPAGLQEKRASLRAGLHDIKSCGLSIGSGRINFRSIPSENWTQSWKHHFQPIEVGDALLIKPSWSKRRPRVGQATIVLDPGLSFGTGQHPTTAFCLRELVRFRQRAQESSLSLLDIGTGSGILAIAAAKLGYSPIQAFDIDSQCIRVARDNARFNRVRPKIRLARADLARLPYGAMRRYDVVCANLLGNLLIAERDKILARVKLGGTLVLAGILKSEFEEVQKAYEAACWRLARSNTKREWRSGSFVAV